jgi:hypothetical protein
VRRNRSSGSANGRRIFGTGDHFARLEYQQSDDEDQMAKKRKRKYSRAAGTEVKREMHRYKRGKAKSGKGGKAGKVKSRKQAIAIALSKARKKGKKVPKKK